MGASYPRKRFMAKRGFALCLDHLWLTVPSDPPEARDHGWLVTPRW